MAHPNILTIRELGVATREAFSHHWDTGVMHGPFLPKCSYCPRSVIPGRPERHAVTCPVPPAMAEADALLGMLTPNVPAYAQDALIGTPNFAYRRAVANEARRLISEGEARPFAIDVAFGLVDPTEYGCVNMGGAPTDDEVEHVRAMVRVS